jgi:ATP-binding cassette subfamily A (ABC1) protein 3
LANPAVEFLDEPTTGVDPISRRSLFKMLKHLKDSSIMLTTHRMDEAEALCDKIAIMINGRFVCIGSPGHLKQKYGDGYSLTVTVGRGQNAQTVDQTIIQSFALCQKEIAAAEGTQSSKVELFYKIQSLSHRQNNQRSKLSDVFQVLNQYK